MHLRQSGQPPPHTPDGSRTVANIAVEPTRFSARLMPGVCAVHAVMLGGESPLSRCTWSRRTREAQGRHREVEFESSGQGKTDTKLSYQRKSFVVIRTDIPEIRMLPPTVIEHLDVSDDIAFGFLTCGVITVRRPFAL